MGVYDFPTDWPMFIMTWPSGINMNGKHFLEKAGATEVFFHIENFDSVMISKPISYFDIFFIFYYKHLAYHILNIYLYYYVPIHNMALSSVNGYLFGWSCS